MGRTARSKSTVVLLLGAVAAAGLAMLFTLSPGRPETPELVAQELATSKASSAPGVVLDAAAPAGPADELPEPQRSAAPLASKVAPTAAASPRAETPATGPLVGLVLDLDGDDPVPGVVVKLVCEAAELSEECTTDLSGRFETENAFPPLRTTATLLDPEGGGKVGSFAWSWDAERGRYDGISATESGALRFRIPIGPTFVFDLSPRELRTASLRAAVVETWSAGALSGVLVRPPRDKDYRLRTTGETPETSVGSAFYPNRREAPRGRRSVVPGDIGLRSWGTRPVRGEGPCWIRYGRGKELRGSSYVAHLEVEVLSDGSWDRVELESVTGVHPGKLTLKPRHTQSLSGLVVDASGSGVEGAFVAALSEDGDSPFPGWATTSQSGDFTFRDAKPGTYRLMISTRDLIPVEQTLRLGKNGVEGSPVLSLPSTGARGPVTGWVACPHARSVLIEVVPEDDRLARQRQLVDTGATVEGIEQVQKALLEFGAVAPFAFPAVPAGGIELSVTPVSDRGRDHAGGRFRLEASAPAQNLVLRCLATSGSQKHFLQAVPADPERTVPPLLPMAALGPTGVVTERSLPLFTAMGTAVELGSYPNQSPLDVFVWSEGYRPVMLKSGDFEDSAGVVPSSGARVARAELSVGWGARLYFLDATSYFPDDLESKAARSLRKEWRNSASNFVLGARPLAGVRLFAGGTEIARSDASGVAWIVGDSQPGRIELLLPGWRAADLAVSGIGGPLRYDVVWMLPD